MMRNPLTTRFQDVFVLSQPVQRTLVQADDSLTVVRVTEGNVAAVGSFRSRSVVSQFEIFLEEQRLGVFALNDECVIGHAWATICAEPRLTVNGYMRVYEGDALIHHCNVDEAFRGRNVYPRMLAVLAHRLQDVGGVRRILIDTEHRNESSLRGIRKAGFAHLGHGTYLQVGGLTVLWHQSRSIRPQIRSADTG